MSENQNKSQPDLSKSKSTHPLPSTPLTKEQIALLTAKEKGDYFCSLMVQNLNKLAKSPEEENT